MSQLIVIYKSRKCTVHGGINDILILSHKNNSKVEKRFHVPKNEVVSIKLAEKRPKQVRKIKEVLTISSFSR